MNIFEVKVNVLEFVDRDSGIDFDTEMKRIQKEFKQILKDEKDSQQELINAFKLWDMNYEKKQKTRSKRYFCNCFSSK